MGVLDSAAFWFLIIVFGVIGVIYFYGQLTNRTTVVELQKNYYKHKETMAKIPRESSTRSNAPEFMI